MADQLVLISVPFTGTNFTLDMFRRAGYADVPLTKIMPGRVVYQGHMTSANQIRHARELSRTRPLVIPLRHPYRACESARRRGYPVVAILEAYRELADTFMPAAEYVLPVDAPDRDAYLEIMRRRWHGLQTDWSVVGSRSGTAAMDLAGCTPTDDEREVAELFSAIYGM